VLVLCASNSPNIELLGKHKESSKWQNWSLDDSMRAQFPVAPPGRSNAASVTVVRRRRHFSSRCSIRLFLRCSNCKQCEQGKRAKLTVFTGSRTLLMQLHFLVPFFWA
jgi:hypothetical protein